MQGLMSSYPLTLPHLFHRAERLFGDKTITTLTATGKDRTTYADWAQRTRRLAGALDALGISEDGRVATFAWNSARHLELYFASPCSGRVLHTLNIRLFPEQLSYIVDHAEDEVIFADRSLLKVLWPLVDGFGTVKHIVVMDDGAGDIPEDDRILDYEELIADAEPAEFGVEDENQAAAMCYTSGTTGNPKGVVYSHRSSVLHSMGAMLADTVAVSERDVVLPVVPMFHANAWGLAHAAVMAGAALAFPGPQMTPAAIAELIEDEKVTLAAGVPTIWMGALDELVDRDTSSLRDILCGGSAVSKALSEAYREKLGMPILHAWGMTETSPLGSVCRIKSTLAGPLRGGARRRARDAGHRDAADRVPDRRARHDRRAAVGRRGARRAAGRRPVGGGRLLQRRARERLVHRGRVAAHRRRRDDHAGRLHPARRPHEGPRQVRRRVDLLGRARERDHGPPAGGRGRRHRGARTPSGASARWPAWWPRTAPSWTPTRCASSCPIASPSGGSRSRSNSSRKFRRPRSASSPRRPSGSGSVDKCVVSRRGVEQPGSSSGS